VTVKWVDGLQPSIRFIKVYIKVSLVKDRKAAKETVTGYKILAEGSIARRTVEDIVDLPSGYENQEEGRANCGLSM
jgi:hypothetical protein